jgi:hypothetical protein
MQTTRYNHTCRRPLGFGTEGASGDALAEFPAAHDSSAQAESSAAALHLRSTPLHAPTLAFAPRAMVVLLPVLRAPPQPRSLDRAPAHATLVGVEPVHVTLSGGLSGDYVVEDQRPDGRVVLRPDLSVRAILARHGERELTPEEFERHFGLLPTDGEG